MNLSETLVQMVMGCQSDNPNQWADNVIRALSEVLPNVTGNHKEAIALAIHNIQDWINQGPSKTTSSKIAYKKRHNEGVFPSEQVFCNQKTKARRPLQQVAKAVAVALTIQCPYNPDRFSCTVSEDGIKQGLKQFNNPDKFADKKAIMEAVSTRDKPLPEKATKEVAKLSQRLLTTDRGQYSMAAERIAKLIEEKLGDKAPRTRRAHDAIVVK